MKEWERIGLDSILNKEKSNNDYQVEAIADKEAQLIAKELYTEEMKIRLKERQEER